MPVVAHFGHWYVSILYVVPVLLVVAALTIQSWREKGESDEDEASGEKRRT